MREDANEPHFSPRPMRGAQKVTNLPHKFLNGSAASRLMHRHAEADEACPLHSSEATQFVEL